MSDIVTETMRIAGFESAAFEALSDKLPDWKPSCREAADFCEAIYRAMDGKRVDPSHSIPGRTETLEHVHLTDKQAVITGDPADLPDSVPEDDPCRHNCDAMGCPTLDHVLHRLPFTDHRKPIDIKALAKELAESIDFTSGPVQARKAFEKKLSALVIPVSAPALLTIDGLDGRDLLTKEQQSDLSTKPVWTCPFCTVALIGSGMSWAHYKNGCLLQGVELKSEADIGWWNLCCRVRYGRAASALLPGWQLVPQQPTDEQIVKMMRAIHQGVPEILDEILGLSDMSEKQIKRVRDGYTAALDAAPALPVT